VDAAYGGAIGILPEGRWAMAGVDMADSVVVNPHKWLFVPLDFSVLFTRRLDVVRDVFALRPRYLEGDASLGEPNFMDYSLQLGRRFRALKAGWSGAFLVPRDCEHASASTFDSRLCSRGGWRVIPRSSSARQSRWASYAFGRSAMTI
jgi:hypothetical protein